MSESQEDIDCIENGAPFAQEAAEFCDVFRRLGGRPGTAFVRCYVTFDLFHKVETLQERTDFTLRDYQRLLLDEMRLATALVADRETYGGRLAGGRAGTEDARRTAEDLTQEHYGTLFESFDDRYYYEHSSVLLRERYFEKNRLRIDDIQQKIALDAGCGGGRFTLVLKAMGFSRVHGLDSSEPNIKTAIAKRDTRKIQGVIYERGDALNLPYPDASFDFVLSNGVLHHTSSILRGLQEVHRVLRTSGTALLFLLEKPGGIFLDTIDLLRTVMRPVDPGYARETMKVLGAAGHRIYSILDHTQVPINTRSSREEVKSLLARAGFKNVTWLENGLSYDRVEKLRRIGPNDREAVWKYGVGENRFYLIK